MTSLRQRMQAVEPRAGDDLVQISGNRAHVLIDRPLVIVQDHNQPLGMVRDIIEGLIRNSARERGVAGNCHDVFFAAHSVPGGSHDFRVVDKMISTAVIRRNKIPSPIRLQTFTVPCIV